MSPVLTRSALIVAHGQPSDPAPAEITVSELAAMVGELLPGWNIASATLATPDGIRQKLETLENPFIFPLFMADGWFIRSLLPQRLASAGLENAAILSPFGILPDCRTLAGRIAIDAATAAGWRSEETTLILAAHGSGRSRFPAKAVHDTVDHLTGSRRFADIRVGFIEEDPRLESAARGAGPQAVCLPLFVARWGHVETDIPESLLKARFSGCLLDPIGTHPDVPRIIAHALTTAAPPA